MGKKPYTLNARKQADAEGISSTLDVIIQANKPQTGQIIECDPDELVSFHEHTFDVDDDEKMYALVESIKKSGILEPINIRILDTGEKEIFAGHRRRRAAQIAGLKKVPCVVREMSDEDAIDDMMSTNVLHREIKYSEYARICRLKLKLVKKRHWEQTPEDKQFDAMQVVADKFAISRTQVYRYLQLNNLIPELMPLVDDKTLALTTAVDLSALTQDNQIEIYEQYKKNGRIPTPQDAKEWKEEEQSAKRGFNKKSASNEKAIPAQSKSQYQATTSPLENSPPAAPDQKPDPILPTQKQTLDEEQVSPQPTSEPISSQQHEIHDDFSVPTITETVPDAVENHTAVCSDVTLKGTRLSKWFKPEIPAAQIESQVYDLLEEHISP